MGTFATAALVLVATAWAGAFAMWVLGLPRSEARGPAQLAAEGAPLEEE
jgi:hypothetical protein